MEIHKLNDRVSVSGQILPAELAEVKALGFQIIVMNRPENEELGQPSLQSLKTEAEAQGLEFIYLPVTQGQPIDEQVQGFQSILENDDRRVLAFCRSGMRSSLLWAKANHDKLGQELVVEAARNAGYDVSQFV